MTTTSNRTPWARALAWTAGSLWFLAVAAAAAVLVLLLPVPSATPDRTAAIALGAGLTFAVPATGATVAWLVIHGRRHRRRSDA